MRRPLAPLRWTDKPRRGRVPRPSSLRADYVRIARIWVRKWTAIRASVEQEPWSISSGSLRHRAQRDSPAPAKTLRSVPDAEHWGNYLSERRPQRFLPNMRLGVSIQRQIDVPGWPIQHHPAHTALGFVTPTNGLTGRPAAICAVHDQKRETAWTNRRATTSHPSRRRFDALAVVH